ncbi:MAG: hypothetical protein M5U26_03975 [Planctomycetota bacterium]|nr:hypothetical protein [Planctomycetota bacterium]
MKGQAMGYLVGIGLFCVLPAALATCLAASKGRKAWHGALAGGLLSYLGAIWVVFWKPYEPAENSSVELRRGRALRRSRPRSDARRRREAAAEQAEARAEDEDGSARDPGSKSTSRALRPIRGRTTPPLGTTRKRTRRF